MVPGWEHAVVSQSHIDRGEKIQFYDVAEAGLKMFRSSCLFAMDFKTRSLSVVRCVDPHPANWLG